MNEPFRFDGASVPVVAMAIHAGHEMRPELSAYTSITDSDRLREEDPFTDRWTRGLGGCGRIVVHRSRFECDMNRPRDGAVYRTPEQAWGLTVWKAPLSADVLAGSVAVYDEFYRRLAAYMDDVLRKLDRFVVLDLHSYNHRRGGPEAAPESADRNPDYNLGTASVADRPAWEPVIEESLAFLRSRGVCGCAATVGENVKFGGGHMARWLHGRYGPRVCVLSLEVKKFFMDEWTGIPDSGCLTEVSATVGGLAALVGDRLEARS